MLRVKTGDELVHPCLGTSGAHPRTQARGGEKAMTATIVLVGRPEPKGKEELCVITGELRRQSERLWQHSDHEIAAAIEEDLSANDRWTGAEAPRPQVIGKQDNGWTVRRVLLGGHVAPEERTHAEHRKRLRVDDTAHDALRLSVAREID